MSANATAPPSRKPARGLHPRRRTRRLRGHRVAPRGRPDRLRARVGRLQSLRRPRAVDVSHSHDRSITGNLRYSAAPVVWEEEDDDHVVLSGRRAPHTQRQRKHGQDNALTRPHSFRNTVRYSTDERVIGHSARMQPRLEMARLRRNGPSTNAWCSATFCAVRVSVAATVESRRTGQRFGNSMTRPRRGRRSRGCGERCRAVLACGMCSAPFAGPGRYVVRPLGYRPSRKNPTLCVTCVELSPPGGDEDVHRCALCRPTAATHDAEVSDSQTMADLLRRFYGCAERVLFPEAIIDKVVGDQVMALYLPDVQRRITREHVPILMVDHAMELLRAVGTSP